LCCTAATNLMLRDICFEGKFEFYKIYICEHDLNDACTENLVSTMCIRWHLKFELSICLKEFMYFF